MRRNCRYRNDPTFGIFGPCLAPRRRIESEDHYQPPSPAIMKKPSIPGLRKNAQCRGGSFKAAMSKGQKPCDKGCVNTPLLGKKESAPKTPSSRKMMTPSLHRGRSYKAAFVRSTKKSGANNGSEDQKKWKSVSAKVIDAASMISLKKFRRSSTRCTSYESFDSRGAPSPTPSFNSAADEPVFHAETEYAEQGFVDQDGQWIPFNSDADQECKFSAEILSSVFNSTESNAFRSLDDNTESELMMRCNDSNEFRRPSQTLSDAESVLSMTSLLNEHGDDKQFLSLNINSTDIDQAKNKDASDSVVAWGLLAALLGAPAPEAVLIQEKKQKSKAPINLWQDKDHASDDIDAIMAHSHVLEDGFVGDLEVEIASDGLSEDHDDALSIPSLSDAVRSDSDYSDFIEMISTPVEEEASAKDVAESALAWSALAALLGSPAPSAVVDKQTEKKRKKSFLQNLWNDCEDSDMVSLPCDSSLEVDIESMLNDIPNLSFDEADDISLSSLFSQEQANADALTSLATGTMQAECNEEEITDSVIAWSALSAFLGAPAPKAVRKSSRKVKKSSQRNLWEDANVADDIDMISLSSNSFIGTITFEDTEDIQDDAHSIPSLSPDQCDNIHIALEDAGEKPYYDFIVPPAKSVPSNQEDLTGSVIAWSSLAAMLVSSDVTPATGKSGKVDTNSVANIWTGGMFGDDLGEIISLSITEDSFEDSLDESGSADCGQGGVIINDISLVDRVYPSKVATDEHSIPSLVSGSCDETSPLTPEKSYYSDPIDSSQLSKQNKKEVTESVIAWSALAALMGGPAPKALTMKRKKEAGASGKNIWQEDPGNVEFEHVIDLPLI